MQLILTNPFSLGCFFSLVGNTNNTTRWFGAAEPKKISQVLKNMYGDVVFSDDWYMRKSSISPAGDIENNPYKIGLWYVKGVCLGETDINEIDDRDEFEYDPIQSTCMILVPDANNIYGTYIILEDVIQQSLRHMSSCFKADGKTEGKDLSEKEQFWDSMQRGVQRQITQMTRYIEKLPMNASYSGDYFVTLSNIMTYYMYYHYIEEMSIEAFPFLSDEEISDQVLKPMIHQLLFNDNCYHRDYSFPDSIVPKTDMDYFNYVMKVMEILDNGILTEPEIIYSKLVQLSKSINN